MFIFILLLLGLLPNATVGFARGDERTNGASLGDLIPLRKSFDLAGIVQMLQQNWHVVAAGFAVLFLVLAVIFLAKMMRPRVTYAPKIRSAPQKRESEHHHEMKVVPTLIGFVLFAFLMFIGFVIYQFASTYYFANMVDAAPVVSKVARIDKPAPVPEPPLKPSPVALRATLPPTIIDTEDFGTENNWIASTIAERIADFAHLALQPDEVVPPIMHFKAIVKARDHQVHLEITDFSTDVIAADLKPEFAWDAAAYSALATQLIGKNPLPDSSAITDPLPDTLTTLLQPTAANLAAQDVAISALLQKHPAWAAAHEQAALLLVALALRDRASTYTDYRPMLSRATAHLALAQAFRGTAQPTWAGWIAGAAVRTLSGRETDAVAHLDGLAARTDCPDPAKAWIDALRLRAKDDWRVLTPTATSPLLAKIVWAQVLNDNLTAPAAAAHLKTLGDLDDVSDWGRAELTNRVGASVDSSNPYGPTATAQETKELGVELAAEGAPLVPNQPIGGVLGDSLREKLFVGDHPALKVVGPDMFKDSARRHLLAELAANLDLFSTLIGDKDQTEKFRQASLEQFYGMRRLENLGFFTSKLTAESVNAELSKNAVSWEPWEIADGVMPGDPKVANTHPDSDILHDFYQDGLPFGTAYDVVDRTNTLAIGASYRQGLAPIDGNRDASFYPSAKDLQALAPHSLAIALLDKNPRDLMQATKPWWDYNMGAIEAALKSSDALGENDYIMLMQKRAVLDPGAWFELGDHLRKEGKEDDAATADRSGFDNTDDPVAMSKLMGPLVDYYYNHDRVDDANMVAKKAADTYSQEGLTLYLQLMEKENNLPEAAQVALGLAQRYNQPWVVDQLYAVNKDMFKEEIKLRRAQFFPKGVEKVTITSFKKAPRSGCVFTTDGELLQQAGLMVGDIVVAFDGIKISNQEQYTYVQSANTNPNIDLIVFRQGHYLEVQAVEPDRQFHVAMATYKPGTPL